MLVSIVAAVARNGVIGRDGGLPWRLPDDLRRFRTLTTGHHVVMGRRTWESIGRALPGRTNLVLSRRPSWRPDDPAARAVAGLDRAIAMAAAAGETELFVIGGADVYAAALPVADLIHLTRVDAEVAGDVRFPRIAAGDWIETKREEHPADERHECPFAFVTLARRRAD